MAETSNTDATTTTASAPAVDPSEPVIYVRGTVPKSYRCMRCGATKIKLWREYQTIASAQELLCAPCAFAEEKKAFPPLDHWTQKGYKGKYDRISDQIGGLVPAVPTEDNATFWGYTCVPPTGCDWWYNLPNFSENHVD